MLNVPIFGPAVLLDLLWWIRDGGPQHPRKWDLLGLFGDA